MKSLFASEQSLKIDVILFTKLLARTISVPVSSHANILRHVLDPARIVVNLLLHLTLVLLQVGESLLQEQVFLFLGSNRRVVCVTCQLQLGNDVRHIVLVHCFKNVTHLFNLSTVEFRLLLVLLQLVVSIRQLGL